MGTSKPASPPGAPDPLLDKEQVADLLATTPRHVERLVEAGSLGHCRVGKFIRFTLSDVMEYLDHCHVAAHDDATGRSAGDGR